MARALPSRENWDRRCDAACHDRSFDISRDKVPENIEEIGINERQVCVEEFKLDFLLIARGIHGACIALP